MVNDIGIILHFIKNKLSKTLNFKFCIGIFFLYNIGFSHAIELGEEKWLEDIDFLEQTIREIHPDPFSKINEEDWASNISNIRDKAGKISDAELAVILSQLVANLGDGHTNLEPNDDLGFNLWFPIRFYKFEKGLYITVAHSAYKELVGTKVLNINGSKPAEVLEAVSTVIGADNFFQKIELAPAFMSNATLLYTFGFLNDKDTLELVVEFPDGEKRNVTINAVASWYSPNYRFWGELFGPPHDDYDGYVTPFEGGKPPLQYRVQSELAPPYYANRSPFWFRWDEANKTLLFQFNFAAELGNESFADFRKRMWDFIDNHQLEKFVIDVRYNFGGDGSMMLPLVHDIIKRETINQPGRLFVLTGRQTFSAAVMLLGHLRTHTEAVFVGEPAGAPLNNFGDPVTVTLPNSQMSLNVSSLYWQMGHPNNKKDLVYIDFPVSQSAADYFAGTDTVYEVVTGEEPLIPLLQIFLSKGGDAGLQAYEDRKSLYQGISWWRPLEEDDDLLSRAVDNLLARGDISGAKSLLHVWSEVEPNNPIPQEWEIDITKE